MNPEESEEEEEREKYECEVYTNLQDLNHFNFDATFKLILIGNSGVGKTCIIKRIGAGSNNHKFSTDHEVTIGAEFTTIAAKLKQRTK